MIRKPQPHHLRIIVALALTAGVAGCNDSEKSTAASKPAPKPEPTQQVSEAPAPSTGPRGHQFPPARPMLNPPHTPRPESKPAKTWGESVARLADGVSGAAQSSFEKANGGLNHSIGYLADVLADTGEKRARHEGLSQARKTGDAYRDLAPEDLKHVLDVTSENADAIKILLRKRSDNDVIKHLSVFLTERDSTKAAASARLVIDDVFANAEYAPSKLAEISFAIGEISRRGYYDEVVAGRVALLQGQVDRAANRDRMNGYLKNALFVAAMAAPAYYMGGARTKILDRTTNTVRSVRFAELLGSAEGGLLKTTYSRARGALANLPANAGNFTRRVRMSHPDFAREELRLLGFSETELRQWDIQVPNRRDMIFMAGEDQPAYSVKLRFEPTNRDRLDYAVSDHWDGPLADGKKLLLFRVHRDLRPGKVVIAKTFDEAELQDVLKKLERTSNAEYLTMVDDVGHASQSTIRTDRLENDLDVPTGPRAFKLGPAEPTPEFTARTPVPEVEPKAPFDHLRGAIFATTVGALTATPSIIGYVSGEQDGRDRENLYLERQVDRHARPPETVVSELPQK